MTHTSLSQTKNASESSNDDLINHIIQAWEKHNSFTLLILNSLEEEFLMDYSASKGRSVGEQFAHIHEVRLNWLMEIAPEATKNLQPITTEKISTKTLRESLNASSIEIKKVLAAGLKTGELKGFKGHPVNFYSYLVSHESHHRGQILLSLKQSGHELGPQVSYGIWNW